MTQEQYIIRRKLNVVELAQTLGNISQACRRLEVSRQHYYDIKTTLREEGVEGLLSKTRKRKRTDSRIPEEITQIVLDYCLQFPVHGQVRVSNELKKTGKLINASTVHSVWKQHQLTTKKERLARLEKWAAQTAGILTESQVQALERAKGEKELVGEIETFHPGFLLGQDTLYVGYIKGIGKIYQQTGIDTFSNVGFAKVYTDKSAIPAADLLNDKVLPFFDEYGLSLLRVLTDNGTEYCGAQNAHPYQLFLHLNDVEHSTTRIKSPRTNGATEKLNQIILDEFYNVALRKKLYTSLEEIQTDLDVFMFEYNYQRTNQGKRCQGRTPLQTLLDSIPLYHQYVRTQSLDQNENISVEKNVTIH